MIKDDLKRIVELTDVEALVSDQSPDRARTSVASNGDACVRCCCPFPDHNDRNPSFVIYTDGERKGRFVCTPECGSGDLFTFVQRLRGVNFRSAVEWLKDRLGGVVAFDYFNIAGFCAELDQKLTRTTEHNTCPEIPSCSRDMKRIAWYMQWKRRYSHVDAVKIMERDGLLWCVDDRRYFSDQLQYGMTFSDSIIIPIRDENGEMVMWQAQYVDGRDRNKMFPFGAKLNNAVQGLSLAKQRGYRWALIVEGYWDCVRAWHYGYPAVAMLSAWVQPDQLLALYRNLDLVVTAFDNDDSGRAAAKRIQDSLATTTVAVKHLQVPHKSVLGRKLDVDAMTKQELDHYVAGASSQIAGQS